MNSLVRESGILNETYSLFILPVFSFENLKYRVQFNWLNSLWCGGGNHAQVRRIVGNYFTAYNPRPFKVVVGDFEHIPRHLTANLCVVYTYFKTDILCGIEEMISELCTLILKQKYSAKIPCIVLLLSLAFQNPTFNTA